MLVLVRGGQAVFSVAYDPALRELFVAAKGEGANRNGARMTVSMKRELGAAVVGTAVPPLAQVGAAEQRDALDLLGIVAPSVFVVRPTAAASLQLAYVAAGRLDGYFETGCDAADWLAGALLVREAGRIVSDLAGEAFGWAGDGVLAAGAGLRGAMLGKIGRGARGAGRAGVMGVDWGGLLCRSAAIGSCFGRQVLTHG